MIGWESTALAQVPGGGGEVVCQFVQHGLVTEQTGGTFPVGSADCDLGGEAGADIAIQPLGLLSAFVGTIGLEAADRSGFTALTALQYDFTVTGGNVGDLVPVLVLTSLLQVLVAASSTSGGGASAEIDPFTFVDRVSRKRRTARSPWPTGSPMRCRCPSLASGRSC